MLYSLSYEGLQTEELPAKGPCCGPSLDGTYSNVCGPSNSPSPSLSSSSSALTSVAQDAGASETGLLASYINGADLGGYTSNNLAY
ncbi:unnamed protein product [Protopolystoma xenopodis]|uniref:Uncharacterized protein n=1 Tax=Protopolystoma xenopodis TaxID=117903 RepID=A0A448W9R1_9PLAT|nr:unnamed protein product [Protopolystoma xenopodis]